MVIDEKKSEEEYDKILRRFRYATVIALAVLGGGMIFYHFVEKLNWVDAFYFCVVTLTTIGYGDIVPKTTAGKLFTAVYVLMGIGIIAAFANLTLKRAVAGRKNRQSAQHKKKKSTDGGF